MKRSPLTVTVLTDTHLYSLKNGFEGKAYDRANSKSQILLAESGEVLDAAFAQISADKRSDIVLICGDLTSNGDLESHKEMIAKLRRLKESGKRVYVITATHDFRKNGVTSAYRGDKKIEVPTATRDMLFDMYREFGPDEAISVHRESMSYVVQLSDGYRLFALNDDTNKNGKSGFSDECFEWITAEAERARRDGQVIIAMTHHPLIAPSPIYAMIGKGDMLGDYEARIEQLADIGVSFIFTGHTHIHNISDHCSKRGNRLYDICTGSPIGYPGVMRTVTFADDVDITTDYVSEPKSFRDKGIKLHDALGQQLIGIIRRMIEVAATDVDRLADMAVSISIKPKLVYKFGWIIKPIFKFLNSLKVSTVARWTKKETGLKKEDYADIKDVKVVDIITELVLNLYGGESKYPPETPVYKITVGVLHIIDSILGILHIDMKKITKVAGSATELIEPLLYNTNIDSYTAKLPIPRYYPQGEQGEIVEKPATSETVKKSKKGLPLIIAAALILIVFLPVWLLLILIGFLSNSVKYRDKLK